MANDTYSLINLLNLKFSKNLRAFLKATHVVAILKNSKSFQKIFFLILKISFEVQALLKMVRLLSNKLII